MRLFLGAGFAPDAVRDVRIFRQVGFISGIDDHLAGIAVPWAELSLVVARAGKDARDPLAFHFHVHGHFVEARRDALVLGGHFSINPGGCMRLPGPACSYVPAQWRVLPHMLLHQGIIRHLCAVIGLYTESKFIHHSAVCFHVFVIQSQHTGGKHPPETRSLLDDDHRFIGAGRGDGRGDSGRCTTNDNDVVIICLLRGRSRSFRALPKGLGHEGTKKKEDEEGVSFHFC